MVLKLVLILLTQEASVKSPDTEESRQKQKTQIGNIARIFGSVSRMLADPKKLHFGSYFSRAWATASLIFSNRRGRRARIAEASSV